MNHIADNPDLRQLGIAIRQARQALGLTQGQLASTAGLARETVSLLENGLVTELGFGKVSALLQAVGLSLQVVPKMERTGPDMVALAATAASVSFKESLEKSDLVRALLTGKPPAGKRPHLRALLQDSDAALLTGLVNQLRAQTAPGKLERGLAKLAEALNIQRDLSPWLKID